MTTRRLTSKIGMIILGFSFSACTKMPVRPLDPRGLHQEGYDQCEYLYSQCVGRPKAQHEYPPGLESDKAYRETDLILNTRPVDQCKKELEKCYAAERNRAVTPPPDQRSP